jgi:hypothetical protein
MTTILECDLTRRECPYCKAKGTAVYLRDNSSFGCAACLGNFFDRLPPEGAAIPHDVLG